MLNFLYTRVSTKNQGTTSLKMQQDLCMCFLNNKSININMVYSEISSAYNKKQEYSGAFLKVNTFECRDFVKKLDVDKYSKIFIDEEL